MYDYITKLCRKQAEVVWNHENKHFPGIGQGEARHKIYRRLKLGGGQVTRQPLQHKICKIGMICPAAPVLTEDLCVVQKQKIFNNMLYVRNVHLTKGQAYS
jgi:hypothetical protein